MTGLKRLVALWDEGHWKERETKKKKIIEACNEKRLKEERLLAFPETVPFSGACDLCGRIGSGLNRVCYRCLRGE